MKGAYDEDLLHVAQTMLGTPVSEKIVDQWKKAAEEIQRMNTARRQRNEARAKTLQRTPYPIVVNRLRFLLDKLPLHNTPFSSQLPPNFVLKLPTAPGETSAVKSPRSAYSSAQPSPRSEGRSTSRSLFEAYLDETSLLLGHVSPYLKKLPEETRRELALVARIEEAKREQVLFRCGDEADKFYVILTGLVEVTEKLTTNDRREKYVIANLKKGHVFGETAILNNKTRNASCITVTHCTLITVHKDAFLAAAGPYFFGQKRETLAFLRNRVSVFQGVGRDACLGLLGLLMRVEFPAEKEWEIQRETQVVFIRRGTCSLCLADSVQKKDQSELGESEREGDLEFVKGRAIGSLNREARRRMHRRRAQGRHEVASLTKGDWFGGGWRIVGDSKLVGTLRVVAKTTVEAFVFPVDDLLTYADPEIIRRLREDASFRLTYYLGRREILKEEKHAFGEETEEILRHYREMLDTNAADIAEAKYDSGTPTERYWADASLTRGIAHQQLSPLLSEIFPRGLDPLCERDECQAAINDGSTAAEHPRSFELRSSGRPDTAPSIFQTASTQNEAMEEDAHALAAAVMWERMKRPMTAHRQCLTYAEIVRNKQETE